jgi:hypothetical protein
VVNRARDAALATKDGDKKLSLLDIVPVFKANSLDVCRYAASFSHHPVQLPEYWYQWPYACHSVVSEQHAPPFSSLKARPSFCTAKGLHLAMSTGCYFSHGALIQSSNVLSSISAVPPKVEDTFKKFCYVPYSTLTLASHIKATCGEEEMIFNAQGGLTVKLLDRCNEKLISAVDWHAAARAAEERIHFHHGNARASAFIAHHKLVMDLGRSHNWEVAMEYDIQQCEVAALNPSHDLSSLDLAALTRSPLGSLEMGPRFQSGPPTRV